MSELTLVGLDEDGEHVVLEGPDGQRFRVRIDEALRAAVRRDRPQLELARADAAGTLPPREIQARVRAGETAEEIADASGTPVDVVRRYDGPVLAERQYVAEQARGTRIGHDPGAPVLGDLVTDRLATRAVRSITWDAFRQGAGPWTVEVRFEVGGSERSARWSYDGAARRVRALDDEARWLSETELPDAPFAATSRPSATASSTSRWTPPCARSSPPSTHPSRPSRSTTPSTQGTAGRVPAESRPTTGAPRPRTSPPTPCSRTSLAAAGSGSRPSRRRTTRSSRASGRSTPSTSTTPS